MYVKTIITNLTKEGRKVSWVPKHGMFLRPKQRVVLDVALPSILSRQQKINLEHDVKNKLVKVELATDMKVIKDPTPSVEKAAPAAPSAPEPDPVENTSFEAKSIDELKAEQGLQKPDADVETITDIREAAQPPSTKKASSKTGSKKSTSTKSNKKK